MGGALVFGRRCLRRAPRPRLRPIPTSSTPDTMDILTHTDMADTMADGADIMVDTTDIPMAATVISGREMPVKNNPLLRDRTLRPTLNSYMPTTTTMASLTA